jgi:hypothetical protein
MRYGLAGLVLLALVQTAAAHDVKRALPAPDDFDTRVLARVNGAVITGHDFRDAFDALPPGNQSLFRREPQKLLDVLIQRELVYQAALRAGIEREPDIAHRLAETRRAMLIKALVQREGAAIADVITRMTGEATIDRSAEAFAGLR